MKLGSSLSLLMFVHEPAAKKPRLTKQAVFTYLDKKCEGESSRHREKFDLRRAELQLQRDRFDAEKEEKEFRRKTETDEICDN